MEKCKWCNWEKHNWRKSEFKNDISQTNQIQNLKYTGKKDIEVKKLGEPFPHWFLLILGDFLFSKLKNILPFSIYFFFILSFRVNLEQRRHAFFLRHCIIYKKGKGNTKKQKRKGGECDRWCEVQKKISRVQLIRVPDLTILIFTRLMPAT